MEITLLAIGISVLMATQAWNTFQINNMNNLLRKFGSLIAGQNENIKNLKEGLSELRDEVAKYFEKNDKAHRWLDDRLRKLENKLT